MKLFHWYSDALKQYGQGSIIIMAEDQNAARIKAVANIDTFMRKQMEHLYYANPTEDDLAHIALIAGQFVTDLQKVPSIVKDGVIFAEGTQ